MASLGEDNWKMVPQTQMKPGAEGNAPYTVRATFAEGTLGGVRFHFFDEAATSTSGAALLTVTLWGGEPAAYYTIGAETTKHCFLASPTDASATCTGMPAADEDETVVELEVEGDEVAVSINDKIFGFFKTDAIRDAFSVSVTQEAGTFLSLTAKSPVTVGMWVVLGVSAFALLAIGGLAKFGKRRK